MKKSLISLVLMFVLILTACGKSSTSTTGSSKSSDEGKTQIIKVATNAAGPPFCYVDSKTNKMEGLMVDIINELAKRSGAKTEFLPMEWSSLIPSVQSGKADVISEGMYITDERKKIINFTEPVFGYGEGLIVQNGNTSIKSLDDLKGKTVGVQIGTTYKDMLDKKGKLIDMNIKVYKTIPDLMKDVDLKRLDAAIADKPIMQYMKQKNPNYNIQVIDEYVPQLPGEIGIGVSKKNPELENKLNKAIEEIKKDGTLKEFYKKWGLDWDF